MDGVPKTEVVAVNKAGHVVLGAGVSGLLGWLTFRASTWLKGEVAYYRWRRRRFHGVTFRSSGAVPAEHLASGRALVWDGRTPPGK